MKVVKYNINFLFSLMTLQPFCVSMDAVNINHNHTLHFMVVNQHFLSAVWILIPNVLYRAPEMPIPELPTTVDLKLNCGEEIKNLLRNN